MIRRLLPLVAAMVLALPAMAESWPTRPVRLLITFAPGGAADTLARTIAPHFPQFANGQPLVVENRPGAGGTIAAAAAATAAPDGYTLLLADIGANAVAKAMFRSLPYDPATAFAPVIHLVNLPMVLVTQVDAPFSDMAGLLAAARARPGGLNYSSAGPGGASHLAMELLNRSAGITTTHVPYRGGTQVVAAVMQKEVDISIGTVSTALGLIRAGQVRALAVGTEAPTPLLPGVPPIGNTVPGYAAYTWHGVLAPAGTPPAVIAAANQAFAAAIALPAVRERLAGAQGAEVVGGTPEAFGAFIAAEIAKWTPVVRDAGIRAD